jgi:hypothetical protein
MTRAWRDKDGDLWCETGPGIATRISKRLLDAAERTWLLAEAESANGPLEELLTAAELLAKRPDGKPGGSESLAVEGMMRAMAGIDDSDGDDTE